MNRSGAGDTLSAMRRAGGSSDPGTSRRMFESLEPEAPPHESGEIEVRVRYCECDPMRVAHHASYIAWMEMGRTELLRPSGISYRDMEEAGLYLAVSKLSVEYKAPVFYDDRILVRTRVAGGGRARIDHVYEFHRLETGTPVTAPLAIGASTLACIDQSGRPKALPAWLAQSRQARRG